jgi:hypothetical protein
MDSEKNREQRRREQYGGSGPSGFANETGQQNLTATPPPTDGADESVVGTQDQSQTKLTGAGTRGATQTDERTPRHPGAHVQHSTNG